jgi:hypothetical protein
MRKRVKMPESVREAFRAFGRQGGKKGGRARMDALTPEERIELARKAAQARWRKGQRKGDAA